MSTNSLHDIEIDEISILSASVRPAVRAARIVVAKSKEIPTMNEPLSFDTLEDAMRHLQSVHGLSKLDAMSAAAREHPTLLRKYNAEGIAKAEMLARQRPAAASPAVKVWDNLVSEIAAKHGVPRWHAMQIAARQHPDEFADFQAA